MLHSEDVTFPITSFNFYLFPFVPLIHPPSWVPETHMGALPPGKPVWVPIHSVLTLPPSVNSSPVCCSSANRTIQMVSSLLSPRPPTLAPSEGRGDSLSDLCSSETLSPSTRLVLLINGTICGSADGFKPVGGTFQNWQIHFVGLQI